MRLRAIAGAAVVACGIAAACGDDEENGAGASSSGETDGGGSSSGGSSGGGSSSGGSSTSSSGGGSGDAGDAAPLSDASWHYEDASPLPNYDFVGVWGTSTDNAYVIGRAPGNGVGGGIYRWSPGDGGLMWRSVYSNAQRHYEDIHGTGANDIWAMGYTVSPSGSVVSVGFDGGAWTDRVPDPGFVTHIWGAGADDWWAVTSNIPGKLRHLTGGSWSDVAVPGASSVEFVTGGGGHVYVYGYAPVDGGFQWSVHDLFNGTWSARPIVVGTLNTVKGMWASGPNDIFVVGDVGMIWHWNGMAFTPQTSGTTKPLYGVFGFASNDVFAVGSGIALHWDGATWSSETVPASAVLLEAWGASPNDLWAVGNTGQILHRTR